MDDGIALSVKDAAERLSMSRGALYPLVMSGEIPSIKVGKRRLVPVEGLQRWLAARPREHDSRATK